MAMNHLEGNFASFNTSSSPSHFNNLINNNMETSVEHFITPFTTPMHLLPPSTQSTYFPAPLDVSRPLNAYKNEQNFHTLHHQPRSNGFSVGRDVRPQEQYQNVFCPPWPMFEPAFDMRNIPQLPRPIKQKRPKMSLQKRLLVNARERERMRILNKAFESLRDALPCYIADGHMAKITTLRLAINYIKALTDLLNENPQKLKHSLNNTSSEQKQEEIFSNIFRGSTSDGARPIFKNLDERLAISRNIQE